jgi:hypothetical protein
VFFSPYVVANGTLCQHFYSSKGIFSSDRVVLFLRNGNLLDIPGLFLIHFIPLKSSTAPNGEFPLDVTIKLLEDTMNKKLGAWGIQDEYAVFMTRIAANTDVESLWNALILTLESADEMEAVLTGDADEF